MKVIQINTIFPDGSTGKIVNDLHCEYQKRGIESLVIYGHGKPMGKPFIRVGNEALFKINALYSRITGLMYGGCVISTRRIIGIIKKEKPDIVHLQCLNGHICNIYRLVKWLNDNKIKTVLTLHAEFMFTANCGHALDCEKYLSGCGNCPRLKAETKTWLFDGTHKSWLKMKNAFSGFDYITIVSVSPWLKGRAESSPMLRDFNHSVVLNGTDTELFSYKSPQEPKGSKIVFHVTPSFTDSPYDLKGGRYIMELARQLKDVKFYVAGRYDANIKPPENLSFLGFIADQNTLAEWYSRADVTVLTSEKETFSMVCAESLCCGTPVVGFKSGGPEQISLEKYSSFVEYGNSAALLAEVEKALAAPVDKVQISQEAKQKYSSAKMAEDYIGIYNALIG